MIKTLELFAGSKSFSKVADTLGFETFSIDNINYEKIDLVKDIEFLQKKDIHFIPDIIWISPPCTSFSIAGIRYHRNGQFPISNFAKKSDRLLKKCLEVISWFPNAIFYIENPRGMLRKMDYMKKLNRKTICYCKYGDNRMKPTDIWTNDINWVPRPMCHNHKYDRNGNIINRHCHHESARRGAKTGTQGLKNKYEKSKIPQALFYELLIDKQKKEGKKNVENNNK